MRTLFDGYQTGKLLLQRGLTQLRSWIRPHKAKVAEGSQARVPRTGFPTPNSGFPMIRPSDWKGLTL
jgi:hypothetical protein